MKMLIAFALTSLALTSEGQKILQPFTSSDIHGNAFSFGNTPMQGMVAIFTSNDCAFDNFYPSRINALTETYAGKIQFVLINSGTEPDESIDQMMVKYKARGFTLPYLPDKDQALMEMFGATRTPEAFLVQHSGGKMLVVYHGAIDDNPQVAGDVKQSYLREAIDKLLIHQRMDVPLVRAAGCTIRRK